MHPVTFAATHSGQCTQTDLDHANLSHRTCWNDRQTTGKWSQVSGDDKEGHGGPLCHGGVQEELTERQTPEVCTPPGPGCAL